MLAAANMTGLLTTLMKAMADTIPVESSRLARHTSRSRQMLLLTLLFCGVVGIHRTWDLRSYTGDALGLLTGRKRAYGYFHTERFLAEVARSNGAEVLTNALARWTTHLWQPQALASFEQQALFYIDRHRKPVYTDTLIPRSWLSWAAKHYPGQQSTGAPP
ncbi:hypothetical protein [Ktedonobacter sp. SOSP1-52]|uniref:hypothetical protein n=1 Tax=Ktedonobacter sp. SOSP1-52 TaxID=2778366 RepID=UPI0019162E36|nr:hypothetical protein [Ktedonobacter sp. SOSP1-52]